MPLMVAWLLLLMWGFTLLVAALGGRFRDAVAFTPLIVQAGIFLTPVGLPAGCSGFFRQGACLQSGIGFDRRLALVPPRYRA